MKDEGRTKEELVDELTALRLQMADFKAAEAKHKETEKRLRSLYHAVEQGRHTIVITDHEGRIVHVNPKFTELTSYTFGESIGQIIRILNSGEHPPEFYKELWDTISSGKVWRGVFRNKKKNGQLFWEDASITPVIKDGGRITHYIVVNEDITDRKKAEEKLDELTYIDELTGIANRRSYNKAIVSEWNRAKRGKTFLSVIMMDIDYFKPYNDILGHVAGDECLRSVAQALKSMIVRAGDLIARYGGEEFIVILPGIDLVATSHFAEMMRKKVESLEIKHSGSKVSGNITISLGVASIIPGEEEGPDVLVSAADSELYKAKEAGRNCVKVSNSANLVAIDNRDFSRLLESAE